MQCLSVSCFFSSRRRHTRLQGDWSSDVCSSDLCNLPDQRRRILRETRAARHEQWIGGRLGRVPSDLEETTMYKSYLRARETWAMPAALVVLMSCLWLPAARGDIFVSNGAGGPYASQVWSYSQYTGAYK